MKRLFMKIFPILLVVFFIIFFIFNAVKNHREYNAQIKAKKIHKERIEQNVISKVDTLLKKHNAFDWVKKIEDRQEDFYFTPILTVDLEKLWLTDRPNLFIGTIEDIESLDQEYQLLRLQGVGDPMTPFVLELKCPIQELNSLINRHPDLTRGITSGVAVIANIDKIKTAIVPAYEGSYENIRIAEGKTIDIVYLDDIWIWYHHEI